MACYSLIFIIGYYKFHEGLIIIDFSTCYSGRMREMHRYKSFIAIFFEPNIIHMARNSVKESMRINKL